MNSFRCAFANVRCMIIDEVSTMPADTLALFNHQLRYIGKMNEPFGSFDTVLCGDLRQLPPVCTSDVFKLSSVMRCIQPAMSWHKLRYYALSEVVRQTDKTFSTPLTKIGNGATLTDDEVKLIENRLVTKQEAAEKCPEDIRIFHAIADAYNAEAAARCTGEFHECPANGNIMGTCIGTELELAKAKVQFGQCRRREPGA